MKHRYHVTYLFPTGHGSIHITTSKSAMTADGMLLFKKFIEDENPQLGNVVVANVIPLKQPWQFWK